MKRSVEDYKKMFRAQQGMSVDKLLGPNSEKTMSDLIQTKIIKQQLDYILPEIADAIATKLAMQIIEENKSSIVSLIERTIQAQIRQPADGKQGERGRDGKDGKDGKQGKQGIPGKDGKTPIKYIDYFTTKELEEFSEKVRSQLEVLNADELVKEINKLPLTADKQIDAKHIKGLPKAVKESTALHRGGLKLVYNTQLSGTVNGSNTVFTVPANLPRPKDGKFIVSARGVLKDTDSGDFTVSSDNRTITFTTAPPNGSAQPRIPIYEAH